MEWSPDQLEDIIRKMDFDEWSDQAALLKHYMIHHPDELNNCSDISLSWKVAFLGEPAPTTIDVKETHWRDLLEDKRIQVIIQEMVWPRVR